MNTFFKNFEALNTQWIALIGLVYFGLLWLSVIIWATRDAFGRSDSLFFHTFVIFLNIIPPPLGVLLYLIIRPSKTRMERYYEEMEHGILAESAEEEIVHCGECKSQVKQEDIYCHHCGGKLKSNCIKCKEPFSVDWLHCPHCGKKRVNKKESDKKEEHETQEEPNQKEA